MDVLTNLFQKHISPEELDELRSVWANHHKLADFFDIVTSQPSITDIENFRKLHQTNLPIVTSSGLSQNLEELAIDFSRKKEFTQTMSSTDKFIPSGSSVEGANLARLFFESTKAQVEFDVMYQFLEINEREWLEQCDQSNPMFVHIVSKIESNQVDEMIKKFGSEIEKFFIYDFSNGKITVCSNYIKYKMKTNFEQFPDLFKQMAGLSANFHKSGWHPEDAAGTFRIVYSNHPEFTGTSVSSPQEFEKEMIDKLVKVSPQIEELGNDGIQKLKQIQDNFLASRLEGKTKVEQIRIAIKLSEHCLLLTDILCNARQETIIYYLTKFHGFEFKELYEYDIRAPLTELYENYLSIFNILIDEPESITTEQTLFDFETYVKSLRPIVGFDLLLQQSLRFINLYKRIPEEAFHYFDDLQIISEKITELSIDFVLCLKCNFWPEVAAEWPEREREWPEQSTIKQIVTNGIHIVCKELHHGEIDWRLSFSVAEIAITQQRTLWQHYIYFIFKSLFYKYLKPLSNESVKVITSFLAKTVMLNVSEKFKQSWWCKENAGECLSVLIKTLISAFESKFLPHHFVSTFNLLERASYDKETERTLECAVDILNSLLLKPEKEVSSLSATLEIVVEFVKATKTQKKTQDLLDEVLSAGLDYIENPLHNYDFNKWK